MRFLCFFLLLMLSCGKVDIDIQNLNGNKIEVIGHGGMGNKSIYPINSLESIIKSLESGVDGVEIDVQLTKDSFLVAFHPKDLQSITLSSGLVNDKTWEQLKDINQVTASNLQYPIFRVQDLVKEIVNYPDVSIVLDCKRYPTPSKDSIFNDVYLSSLNQVFAGLPLGFNIIIESQDTSFLNGILQMQPNIKVMFYPASFEEGLSVLQNTNYYGLTIDSKKITKEEVDVLHNMDKRVAVWNVSSARDNRNAIQKNPDYIQTDAIGNLIKLLR